MALGARLELRQGQSLVITPQLQQAIKLLQLSNLELEAFVEAELEKNPLLQRDERDAEPEERGAATESESLEVVADATAAAEMDANHNDVYGDATPGERDSGEAGEERAAPAGTPMAALTGRAPEAAGPS
jgi:RNA polymerase sigma-54 factor